MSNNITISTDDILKYSSNISDSTNWNNPIINGNGTTASSFYGSKTYSTISAAKNSNIESLKCSGDANIEGDLTVKGVNIAESIEKINQRLSILVPDPAKLVHFEALQKAYNHYKTIEAICHLPSKND